MEAKIAWKRFSCFPFRILIPFWISLEPKAVYNGPQMMPIVITHMALTKTSRVKRLSAMPSRPKAFAVTSAAIFSYTPEPITLRRSHGK